MKSAVLIVDAQNDFMEFGALEVPGSNRILQPIVNIVSADKFPVFWTLDSHPRDHCSFKRNGGQWPDHCIEDSYGWEIHPKLDEYISDKDMMVYKGQDPKFDSYSGFYDDGGNSTHLDKELVKAKIDHLYVCGLATEYCVKFTVLDALAAGFKVSVVLNAIKGIDPVEEIKAIEEMAKEGAKLIVSRDVLK